MKWLTFAMVSTISFTSFAQSTELIGQITQGKDGLLKLKVSSTQESLTLKINPMHSRYFQSFLGHKTYLKFTGRKEKNLFHADRSPTLISAPAKIEGVLTITDGSIFIGGQKITVQKAKQVNGYAFNGKSINFFNNKEVIANGKLEGDSFLVTALIPANLYSAQNDEKNFAVSGIHSAFSSNPLSYVLETLPKNKYSQTKRSFKGTMIGAGHDVRESDKALVVTLSGRQGDDFSASNGHFASGMASVREDLSLDMEINNYYPLINEKGIIPGVVDYVDYFGGITGGQANYRPTYTLIIYGEDKDNLLKMRDSLDLEFAKLREGEDNFSVKHSCTTVTNDGLIGIGLVERKKMKDSLNPKNVLDFNPFSFAGNLSLRKQELEATIGKNPSYYFPRSAFDSFVKKLKNMNPQRVDYIFHNQTPSDRPVGGAAADEMHETLEHTIKSKIHEKRPYSAEEIWEELNKVD